VIPAASGKYFRLRSGLAFRPGAGVGWVFMNFPFARSDWECVATFADAEVAEVARLTLAARGLEAEVQKDDCGGMQPNLQMLTGIRLWVPRAAGAEARALLAAAADPEWPE
jgi:hypothetical protein